jgi:hypothetical protein
VGDDTAKVTVSGGKPGTAASISLANNISGTAPATFDNSGNAVFTVKGVYPDATKGFTGTGTVTAASTLASSNVSKSINVKLNQFNCNFSQGPSFSYPSTVATTTTESSAKLDYKRTYNNGLILKDMAPGKSISIASAQLVKADGSRQNWNGVTLASNTVASDKTAKLNIAQVSDYNFKKVAVKVNYPSTEIGHLTSKEFILPLYQYNLAIASDKSEIVGDDTAKVTVSGGKPGETVAWSNTGSGKILDGKSTTFDDKGNAYATVQGTAPFTSTIKLSSNSSYATINKDIPVGYFFTNLGDDNSDALRGTWNADRTVKTVTSSTADWSDYLNSGADIVFLNTDNHDGLTCLKFSDGRNVNIPQNFEVTIDKMIPYYEYHQGNDDPSFPTHRKDGYYFYLNISPIWFASLSNASILLSNRNNMNGSYNFTFKFNYNNKDYSFKKTLVLSF